MKEFTCRICGSLVQPIQFNTFFNYHHGSEFGSIIANDYANMHICPHCYMFLELIKKKNEKYNIISL